MSSSPHQALFSHVQINLIFSHLPGVILAEDSRFPLCVSVRLGCAGLAPSIAVNFSPAVVCAFKIFSLLYTHPQLFTTTQNICRLQSNFTVLSVSCLSLSNTSDRLGEAFVCLSLYLLIRKVFAESILKQHSLNASLRSKQISLRSNRHRSFLKVLSTSTTNSNTIRKRT